jgi:putative hemolysin
MTREASSPLSYAHPDDPWWKWQLIRGLEVATGVREIERRYEALKAKNLSGAALWGEALRQLEVSVVYDRQVLARVPGQGPVVFIANHPFGVLDGLALGYLVASVRPQFFVLVHEALTREGSLTGYLLPIDFSETRAALHTNLQTRQQAIARLRAGEALAIFPAGGVSTAPWPGQKAVDFAWKRFVAKLIQQTQATVVPLFFHGQNSPLFHLASRVHGHLRAGLLLHELRNKMGREVSVTLGAPLPFEQLAHLRDRQLLLDHLRAVVEELGER